MKCKTFTAVSYTHLSTPYRKVADGKVDISDEGIEYLTAEEEEDKICLLYTSYDCSGQNG